MEQIIGVRQLHRDMKKVYSAVQKGQSFLVIKNSTPMFRIEPVQKQGKKCTLDDLRKLQFDGVDKNLSKKIDEIVYGL